MHAVNATERSPVHQAPHLLSHRGGVAHRAKCGRSSPDPGSPPRTCPRRAASRPCTGRSCFRCRCQCRPAARRLLCAALSLKTVTARRLQVGGPKSVRKQWGDGHVERLDRLHLQYPVKPCARRNELYACPQPPACHALATSAC